jgi:hypothetical protein
VALSGTLARLDGTPLAGRRVGLEFLGSRGWRSLDGTATDSAGAFSARVKLRFNRAVRARFSGEPGLSGSRSTPLNIGVRPLVTAAVESRPTGGSATIATVLVQTQVRPAKDAALLLVSRRTASGSYRRVARRALRLRRGTAAIRQSFSRSGVYRVQVAVPADKRNLAGRSEPISLDIGQSRP